MYMDIREIFINDDARRLNNNAQSVVVIIVKFYDKCSACVCAHVVLCVCHPRGGGGDGENGSRRTSGYCSSAVVSMMVLPMLSASR